MYIEKLERDANAVLKAILTDMEQLAMLEPRDATDPIVFAEYRKRTVRRIWALARSCMPQEGRNADTI